jgi:hypothetical protein
LIVVIALLVIVGLGYVPDKSPPAAPVGDPPPPPNTIEGSSLEAVIDPSCILDVLIWLSPIFVLVIDPSTTLRM